MCGAPDPTGTWVAYSAPPDPLAVFKGPTSTWRERGEGKVKGRKVERRWREGFGPPQNFGAYGLSMLNSSLSYSAKVRNLGYGTTITCMKYSDYSFESYTLI